MFRKWVSENYKKLRFFWRGFRQLYIICIFEAVVIHMRYLRTAIGGIRRPEKNLCRGIDTIAYP